jgi:BirA family transcriptional regulator, biotin operon repressor / biotin---[acetyl-CoA-carboxylase] ligase
LNNNSSKVIEILRTKRGKAVSGEQISSTLGISRSAVWKQIKALRGKGYRISARSRFGYCLEEEPDHLDQETLAALGIIYRDSVDSTNLVARRLAEEGAPDFTTIIAEQQLSGKGRLGRSWLSPAGSGLWFSIIYRPAALTPGAVSPVTLVTAAVLADYLSREFNLSIQIKWPNDLQVDRKKIAGILTEIKGEPDRIDYLVIGIGLNVNQRADDFSPEIANIATSLAIETKMKIKRTDLLINLRQELLNAYSLFEKEGFTPFRQIWIDHNITLDRQVKINWPGGSMSGLAVGLSDEGLLILKDAHDQIHQFSYGEVS